MTSLTDKMEKLREEEIEPDESGYGAYESGFNECLDHCIALAKAEAALLGDWEAEFREYFDKTLKPKKPTMKNLDREVCVHFITRLLAAKDREKIEAYAQGWNEGQIDLSVSARLKI